MTTSIVNLPEAKKNRDWGIKRENDITSYVCLMKNDGVSCEWGPYKFKFHLQDHMKKVHGIKIPLAANQGRPKNPENLERRVDSKKMNLQVMGNLFKRARKELWKKNKQWKEQAELEWKKIQEKLSSTESSKDLPVLTPLFNGDCGEKFLGVRKIGEGVPDSSKCESLPNDVDFAKLVVNSKTSSITPAIKAMWRRNRNWDANENERKKVVMDVIKWHRGKAIIDLVKEGKEKWVARYVGCSKAVYEMKNATRMDRIEASCAIYRERQTALGDDSTNDDSDANSDADTDGDD